MVNMMKMMKQAAAMQENLGKVQAELAQRKVEFSSGGGMVTVTASGDGNDRRHPHRSEARGSVRCGHASGYRSCGREWRDSDRQGYGRAGNVEADGGAWHSRPVSAHFHEFNRTSRQTHQPAWPTARRRPPVRREDGPETGPRFAWVGS